MRSRPGRRDGGRRRRAAAPDARRPARDRRARAASRCWSASPCSPRFVYGTDTVLFVAASEERLGLGPDGFGVLLDRASRSAGIAAAAFVNRLAASPRLAAVLTLAWSSTASRTSCSR